MKIMIVHPQVTIGGAEKVIFLMARSMKELGHKVTIITSNLDDFFLNNIPKDYHSNLDIISISKTKIIEEYGKNFPKAILNYFKQFMILNFLTKQFIEEFDIINTHNFPAYWSNYLVNNIPIIWTCHEVLGPYSNFRDLYDSSQFFRSILKIIYKVDENIVKHKISAIITNSYKNKNLILKRYGKQSICIYPPIDYEFFEKAKGDFKSEYGFRNEIILLQIGSFNKLKNQLASIRALKIINKRISPAKLILVGKGPWQQILKREIAYLNLQNDVIFLNWLNEYKLKEIYHACDIYLNPVIEQSFGLAPMEALACGKPALLSRNCGAAEIVEHFAPDLIIDPTPLSIANGVAKVIKQRESLLENMNAIKEFIKKFLSPRIYAEKVLKIFSNYK